MASACLTCYLPVGVCSVIVPWIKVFTGKTLLGKFFACDVGTIRLPSR